MMHAVEAIIDEAGTVRLKERVHLRRPCRAIVTILDDDAQLETALLSEASAKSRDKVTSSEDQLVLGNVEKLSSYFWIGTSLAVDWNRPEEDEAWSHLQRLRNPTLIIFPFYWLASRGISRPEGNVIYLRFLGNDPAFKLPAKEGGAFPEVKPVQGKGISASHLLMRDRR